MRKIKRTICILLALALMMSLSACSGTNSGQGGNATTPGNAAPGGETQGGTAGPLDEYAAGLTIDIPAHTFDTPSGSVKGRHTVIFPDGTTTVSDTVTLKQTGVHTVQYTAESGGETYTDEWKFKVNEPYFSYSSPSTTVRYGVYDQHNTAMPGLLVRLAEGDTLVFSKQIYMPTAEHDYGVLMSCFVTPDKAGTTADKKTGIQDFQKLLVTLTDSAIPEHKLTVRYKGMQNPNWPERFITYADALALDPATADRHWYGVDDWDANTAKHYFEYAQGETYCPYGSHIEHSFTAESRPGRTENPDQRPLSLKYSFRDNSVSSGAVVINDLDGEHNAVPWETFPSGWAIMSFSADSYTQGKTANFCITEFAGITSLQQGK